MDVASALNKDVVTEFPVMKAVGKLDPGVYLVTARPWKEKTANTDETEVAQLATQWMVVSDLGLTAISGGDGVHALVESLGSAAPLAGVELKLVARNNEVLAVKTTGADGRADFDPGLARGKGGSAPGLVVATLSGDYNFLNLAQNAFDLTDRGVAGRDAPSGLDAFLYTERGVYRSGETVFAVALLRDAKGVARSGLPLTLVVKRPDGVEYKRATIADEGLGGRAFAVAAAARLGPGQMDHRGLRRPEGRSDRRGRLFARGLHPRAARFHPEGRETLHRPGRAGRAHARRALPLWRAGERPRRHRGDPPAGGRGRGARRLSRLCRGPRRRRLHHRREPVPGQGDDGWQGPRRAVGRSAGRDHHPSARGEADRRRRRARRPYGRAHPDAAGASEGGRGRGEAGLRLLDRRRRAGDVRGDRGRARRDPRRPQGRGLVALSGDQRLSVVQQRRTLELRAGQVVEAGGERRHRHRRRRAGEVCGARQLGRAQARHQDARRRGDERRVRRRLVGNGERRHARQRRRHPRQDGLRAGRRGEAAHRLALRRQGDGRAHRRRDRALRRRRPRRGRQYRAVRGRGRLGPGRLCGGADPPAARRPGQAHARPRHRARLVRHRGRAAQARRRLRRAAADEAARAASGPDHGRRARAGRGGACHRLGGRSRHPQPDGLQDAGPGLVFLRPAQAAGRDPRPLGHADRRHAGGRPAPFRPAAIRAAISKAICRPKPRSRSFPGSSSSTIRARRR